MNESEMLQYALRQSQRASNLIHKAYDSHDHDSDLHVGVALSAAKLSAEALVQELTAILMSIKQN